MGTCIFCFDHLNKGIQNHMIHTHKLSKLEFDLLFISNENPTFRKLPYGTIQPEISETSLEFNKFFQEYQVRAEFIFNDYQNNRKTRKYKKSEKEIRKALINTLERKIIQMERFAPKLGGGEFINLSFEILATKKILDQYKVKSLSSSDQPPHPTVWDKIEFANGYTLFNYHDNHHVRIETPSSNPLLNQIKKGYFEAKYPTYYIHVDTSNNKLKIHFPEDETLEQIIKLNKTEIEVSLIKHQLNKVKLQVGSGIKFKDSLRDKNEYIKCAVGFSLQNDEIYPISENNNGHIENGILFVFHRKNLTYVLLENENSNRSAYLLKFVNYQDKYLEMINSFISSELINKRGLLKSKQISFDQISGLESTHLIYHKELSKFKEILKYYLE